MHASTMCALDAPIVTADRDARSRNASHVAPRNPLFWQLRPIQSMRMFAGIRIGRVHPIHHPGDLRVAKKPAAFVTEEISSRVSQDD